MGFQFRAEASTLLTIRTVRGSGCSGTTNITLDPTNPNFGKVLTKGGGVGGGERNLQLSLRFTINLSA